MDDMNVSTSFGTSTRSKLISMAGDGTAVVVVSDRVGCGVEVAGSGLFIAELERTEEIFRFRAADNLRA